MKNPTLEERKAAVDKLLEAKIGQFESIVIIGQTKEGIAVSMAMVNAPFIAEAWNAFATSALGTLAELGEMSPSPDQTLN